MFGPLFWLGTALLVVILLATTAHAAIRHGSRVVLAKRLEKRGRSDLLAKLSENRDELLFVVSLIRLSSILVLLLLIAHLFGIRPGSMTGDTSSVLLLYGAVFVTAAALVMFVGVAVPDAWARYGGAGFLAFSLPSLLVLTRLLFPVLACQRLIDWVARRLAGVSDDEESMNGAGEIEQEILGVVSEGEAAGAVHEEYADMIEAVVQFRDTDVGEIMTPRTEIISLPASASLAETKELITREGHSRIPVYEENLDNIKGVLYAKDLLLVSDEGGFSPLPMLRKVPYVPESKRIPDLLQELREQNVHLAIVLDEYGGTAGLVTIEDILEEIVGEITDEYETPEPEPISRIDEHTLEIDARVHIDELNEELKTELPEGEDYETVGGFVFNVMGKIPQTGDELTFENVRFEILQAEERRINRLRVELIAEEG